MSGENLTRAQVAALARKLLYVFQPHMFLLGLGDFKRTVWIARERKVEKAVKKAELVKVTERAKPLTVEAKITAKEKKKESVIRTAMAVNAKKAEGKAAQVQAAEEQVALRLAEFTAARNALTAANNGLAASANVVKVLKSTMKAAAAGFAAAIEDWTASESTETPTEAVQAMRDAAEVLADQAVALRLQIDAAPAKAGDDMSVHLARLAVLRRQLGAAVLRYSAELVAWGGGASGPGLALANAGQVLLATVSSLDVQLAEFVELAEEAQSAQSTTDGASEALAGARAVLAALNRPESSPRAAFVEVTAEMNALIAVKQIAERSAITSSAQLAVLGRQLTGMF